LIDWIDLIDLVDLVDLIDLAIWLSGHSTGDWLLMSVTQPSAG
jgi:hypothetical protein